MCRVSLSRFRVNIQTETIFTRSDPRETHGTEMGGGATENVSRVNTCNPALFVNSAIKPKQLFSNIKVWDFFALLLYALHEICLFAVECFTNGTHI